MIVKKWLLVKHFEGEAKEENLQLIEEKLSTDLQENEVLLEALYLSVDPYMRPFTAGLKLPAVMIGEQISKVIKSKNSKFPVGTLVRSNSGWVSHYISNGSDLQPIAFDLGETSPSYCLGVLGMTGATGYFGLRLLEPKEGETLVLTGASGAVGPVVGQLAKIKGCKVIGFVGSDDKLAWCKDELGFDHVFNYKKVNIGEAIKEVAPEGVEMFYDNVGGDFFPTIVNNHMKVKGRIVVCGNISDFNEAKPKLYPSVNYRILHNQLKIQGLHCFNYLNEWPQALSEIAQYLQDGRLKARETVYEGFDKMRDALYGLFKGENIGKAVVKA